MGELIFETREVRYRYPHAADDAVRDVALDVPPGELIAIVGPNGSGKTTLVRLLLGVLSPTGGTVLAGGRPAAEWKRRDLARLVGVVAQREEPVFPLRVEQAVLFGRYPHLGALGTPGPEDRAAVDKALRRCDVAHLGDRWVATLSGGEWQRVRIARALAQEPRALVLDEATANLDIRHEMEVFELAATLVRDEGLAAVAVTHHVNLAARFADRIVVMDRGIARAQGRPLEVLQREVLERVFGWPVEVSQWRGVPQLVPLRAGEEPGRGDPRKCVIRGVAAE
jgi:iron complex transport system ATP-binding protein